MEEKLPKRFSSSYMLLEEQEHFIILYFSFRSHCLPGGQALVVYRSDLLQVSAYLHAAL